jgi:hypothetical protein
LYQRNLIILIAGAFKAKMTTLSYPMIRWITTLNFVFCDPSWFLALLWWFATSFFLSLNCWVTCFWTHV